MIRTDVERCNGGEEGRCRDTTIAEAMLDCFQLIDERERIGPKNTEIHRIRVLLMLFAAAVLAAGLLALAGTKSAWAELSGFVAAPKTAPLRWDLAPPP
jgi:hypothetical protein